LAWKEAEGEQTVRWGQRSTERGEGRRKATKKERGEAIPVTIHDTRSGN